MKTKADKKFMTGWEVAFEVLTQAVDKLQYELAVPRSEILTVLGQITGVMAVNSGGQAALDAAIATIEESGELTKQLNAVDDKRLQ